MAKLPGNEEAKVQMQNLGIYLPHIRNGFKWTLDDVGNRLGVSKQTILNIEQQARKNIENSGEDQLIITKDCMTYAQYITLRLIIEDEIACLKEKDEETAKRIKFIMLVLVDGNTEELKGDDKKIFKTKNKISLMKYLSAETSITALFAGLAMLGISNPLFGFEKLVKATTAIFGTIAGLTSLNRLQNKNNEDKK